MNPTDVLILEGLTDGQRARVARQVKRLRQSDVAYLATRWLSEHGGGLPVHPTDRGLVSVGMVGFFERDWQIPSAKRLAILSILGLTP